MTDRLTEDVLPVLGYMQAAQDDIDLLTVAIPVPRSETDTWSEERRQSTLSRMASAALDALDAEQ